jgi:K(+)-stimulated pyrophosphate-energized sodium pump
LLAVPAVVQLSIGTDANSTMRLAIALGSTAIIVIAVWWSKRKSVALSA